MPSLPYYCVSAIRVVLGNCGCCSANRQRLNYRVVQRVETKEGYRGHQHVRQAGREGIVNPSTRQG